MKIFHLIAATIFVSFGTGCATTRIVKNDPAPKRVRIYFDFDKYEVPARSKTTLEAVATDLKPSPKGTAILEGHTDPIGSNRYNEILAEQRARSVRVYLRDLGIDGARTTILSKGKRVPAVPGRGREANSLNRRVEVIYSLNHSNKKTKQGRKP